MNNSSIWTKPSDGVKAMSHVQMLVAEQIEYKHENNVVMKQNVHWHFWSITFFRCLDYLPQRQTYL